MCMLYVHWCLEWDEAEDRSSFNRCLRYLWENGKPNYSYHWIKHYRWFLVVSFSLNITSCCFLLLFVSLFGH